MCCSLCWICGRCLKCVKIMSSSLLQAVAPVLSIRLHRYLLYINHKTLNPAVCCKPAPFNSVAYVCGQLADRACMMTSWLWLQPAKKNTQGLRELFIAPPSHCLACSEAFQEEHGHEALVYHGNPPMCSCKHRILPLMCFNMCCLSSTYQPMSFCHQ